MPPENVTAPKSKIHNNFPLKMNKKDEKILGKRDLIIGSKNQQKTGWDDSSSD